MVIKRRSSMHMRTVVLIEPPVDCILIILRSLSQIHNENFDIKF